METLSILSQKYFETLRQKPPESREDFRARLQAYQQQVAVLVSEGRVATNELEALVDELQKVLDEPGAELILRGYVPVEVAEAAADASKGEKIDLLKEPYFWLQQTVMMLQAYL